MGSAVGYPLAARVGPVRGMAILRRALRLKVEVSRPLFGSTRPPTAFRPIWRERKAAGLHQFCLTQPQAQQFRDHRD